MTETDQLDLTPFERPTLSRQEQDDWRRTRAEDQTIGDTPKITRKPCLKLEHGFIRSIQHRIRKNRERGDGHESGQESNGEGVPDKGKTFQTTTGKTVESKTRPVGSQTTPQESQSKPCTGNEADARVRCKRRPSRMLYIPPNRRTGANSNDLIENYNRSIGERPESRQQCLDTRTQNILQVQAEKNKYKKVKEVQKVDLSLDQRSDCSSSPGAWSIGKSADKKLDMGTGKEILVHIDRTHRSLAPLDELTLSLFPEEIKMILRQAYQGGELGGKVKDTLVESLVNCGVNDSKLAATIAKLCSNLIQIEARRGTSSVPSEGDEADLPDRILAALLSYSQTCIKMDEGILIFSASLLGCVVLHDYSLWRYVPLSILGRIDKLTTNPSWKADISTVQLVVDVLCRCGHHLEVEYLQHVDDVMHGLRLVLLGDTAPTWLRKRVLFVMELRASRWRIDQDMETYYSVQNT